MGILRSAKSGLVGGLVAMVFASIALGGNEAGKDDPVENPAVLREEVKTAKAEMDEAQAEAEKVNKEYLNFEDRLVYTNDVVGMVYRQVRELEKKLVEKRQQLREEMMKVPEMRELMKKRDTAFEKARKLRDRWQMLFEELNKKERARTGSGKDS